MTILTSPCPMTSGSALYETLVQILPVELGHVLALSDLPPHHKDPFDRILVAQALAEDAYLVSADEALARYPASLFW